jgi:ATP-dependent HslUV protease ATP-binding subunit HslU
MMPMLRHRLLTSVNAISRRVSLRPLSTAPPPPLESPLIYIASNERATANHVRTGRSRRKLEIALKPSEIVNELDKYVVGQNDAKRAVAVALRNRWRRAQLTGELRRHVMPKNILMIGPTGCGKTEIARSLALLAQAPFVKVEASAYSENGSGKSKGVDSIIGDMLEVACVQVKKEILESSGETIENEVERQLILALQAEDGLLSGRGTAEVMELLRNGGMEDTHLSIQLPPEIYPRKMSVRSARFSIRSYHEEQLLNGTSWESEAVRITAESGIVFLDELDKVCTPQYGGPFNNVQRDLLPLIEGTLVSTRLGPISTSHILFICSGAFMATKPSELLPELQGRLPIRVEVKALSEKDLYGVLTQPKFNILKQTQELLETEGIHLKFADSGIRCMAHIAADVNYHVLDIGARRLSTIVEKVIEDISFNAPDLTAKQKAQGVTIIVDEAFVKNHVGDVIMKTDLSSYVL